MELLESGIFSLGIGITMGVQNGAETETLKVFLIALSQQIYSDDFFLKRFGLRAS